MIYTVKYRETPDGKLLGLSYKANTPEQALRMAKRVLPDTAIVEDVQILDRRDRYTLQNVTRMTLKLYRDDTDIVAFLEDAPTSKNETIRRALRMYMYLRPVAPFLPDILGEYTPKTREEAACVFEAYKGVDLDGEHYERLRQIAIDFGL